MEGTSHYLCHVLLRRRKSEIQPTLKGMNPRRQGLLVHLRVHLPHNLDSVRDVIPQQDTQIKWDCKYDKAHEGEVHDAVKFSCGGCEIDKLEEKLFLRKKQLDYELKWE